MSFHCAHENVKQLKSWFEEKRKNEEPSIERSLEIYYQLDGRIEDMKAEDIAYFSKEFILKFASNEIDHIWEKLSNTLILDHDIIGYRRCLKHYNYVASDYDIFDGPYPLIKNCHLCNKEKI
ncbi:hypothetical protein PV325_008951 [Microctonus aethiopoides]|nr:hypothetical protein PV325_008951 [Microctonus aethiopoides]